MIVDGKRIHFGKNSPKAPIVFSVKLSAGTLERLNQYCVAHRLTPDQAISKLIGTSPHS